MRCMFPLFTALLLAAFSTFAAAPLVAQELRRVPCPTMPSVIAVASGMSFEDFVQQRILDPLALKHTTYWPTDEQASALAIGFVTQADHGGIENFKPKHQPPPEPGVPTVILSQFGSDSAKFYKNHYAWAAGGLFSRAGDLLTFERMILNGGEFAGKRYLSEAAFKEMITHRPEYPGSFAVPWTVQTNDNGGGNDLAKGSFGHHGARGSAIWIDPGKGLIMAFLMQAVDLKGKELDDIKRAFFKAAQQLQAIPDANGNAK